MLLNLLNRQLFCMILALVNKGEKKILKMSSSCNRLINLEFIRLGICPSALVYDENLGNEEKSQIF